MELQINDTFETIKEALTDLDVLLDAGYTVVNIEGGPIFDGWRTNLFENLKDVRGLQVGFPKMGSLKGISLAPLPGRYKDKLALRYDADLVRNSNIITEIEYHFDDVHCLSLHGQIERRPNRLIWGYNLFDTLNSIKKYNREEEFSNRIFVSYDPRSRRFIPSEIRTKVAN